MVSPRTAAAIDRVQAAIDRDGVLSISGIRKEFPGVLALDDVQLRIRPGTVHALMGENGAGKSTLMKIIAGVYQPDAGEILVGGEPIRFKTPTAAIAAGIGMVHQHFMLADNLTVAENVVLGAEGMHGIGGGARAEIGRRGHAPLPAEVVGFRDSKALLMPFGPVEGVAPGADIKIIDAAAAQVNTWLSDTRDWLDHQAKARRGD